MLGREGPAGQNVGLALVHKGGNCCQTNANWYHFALTPRASDHAKVPTPDKNGGAAGQRQRGWPARLPLSNLVTRTRTTAPRDAANASTVLRCAFNPSPRDP